MEKQQRLIDANALEADLQKQFDKVFTEAGRKVKPEDYFIERHAVWFANVVKADKDSFFEYLKTRPTIDAVPVVRCGECRFRGNPMNCPMCHEEDYYDEDDGFDYIVRDKTTDEGYCQIGEREDDNE